MSDRRFFSTRQHLIVTTATLGTLQGVLVDARPIGAGPARWASPPWFTAPSGVARGVSAKTAGPASPSLRGGSCWTTTRPRRDRHEFCPSTPRRQWRRTGRRSRCASRGGVIGAGGGGLALDCREELAIGDAPRTSRRARRGGVSPDRGEDRVAIRQQTGASDVDPILCCGVAERGIDGDDGRRGPRTPSRHQCGCAHFHLSDNAGGAIGRIRVPPAKHPLRRRPPRTFRALVVDPTARAPSDPPAPGSGGAATTSAEGPNPSLPPAQKAPAPAR